MQKTTSKAKLEFVWCMARHSTASPSDCQLLLRLGATYGRLVENAGNRSLTPEEENKQKRIANRIRLTCLGFDAVPVLGGDPRGNTVKISVQDGYTNDWGREGICVPTS